jgi:hypothetical protein
MFGIKLFIKEWGVYIFVFLQLVFVIYLVNTQLSYIASEYSQMNVIQETGQNLYFYQNVLATVNTSGYTEDIETVENTLKTMDGYEGLAYYADCTCEVTGYQNSDNSSANEIININLSKNLYQGISYTLSSGRWFDETDDKKDTLPVIIGGGLSGKYNVGDIIEVQYMDDVKANAEIIGDLGESFWLLEDAFVSETGYINSFMAEYGSADDVILSNRLSWFSVHKDILSYPTVSSMIKINSGANLGEYEKYGKLVSFDALIQKTKEQCDQYLQRAIHDNIIWIFVVLFGIIASSYVCAGQRKYIGGVCLLMGMSNRKILYELMKQILFIFVLSAIAAFTLTPYLDILFNTYNAGFGIINFFGTAVLLAVLFAEYGICCNYIRCMQPVEILNMTKE